MIRQSYAFPNEETALAAFGITDWDEVSSWVVAHGTLYRDTGETVTDADGNSFPVMEPIEDFHVDAVSATGDASHFPADYRVYPDTPSAGIM